MLHQEGHQVHVARVAVQKLKLGVIEVNLVWHEVVVDHLVSISVDVYGEEASIHFALEGHLLGSIVDIPKLVSHGDELGFMFDHHLNELFADACLIHCQNQLLSCVLSDHPLDNLLLVYKLDIPFASPSTAKIAHNHVDCGVESQIPR